MDTVLSSVVTEALEYEIIVKSEATKRRGIQKPMTRRIKS